ncbi:type I secretion system permease/ATPase [Paralimibaculum aggregatum]|uniref:Type I secretion system permease/ATPase n=1 Tax=Paralimibaculum aggregatum TaxID=3036245 RepID=A0ABQ6LCF1_9RHOB|nr:type I secretion system permease/ATPase [Limibaculum sp. NKW23]GMG81063.1 type I secretion system permease/ATPase [Limibaculum sp. NKW23]
MKREHGVAELRKAMGECRWHFTNVAIFSVFVNLLMLTGPLFMLQTYDRVLTSRSEETLVALLILVTALFGMFGILDFARGRVLARAGARFQSLLDSRVFSAILRRSVSPAERARPNTAARDLDSIRGLLSSPAPFALFDVPWTPIFLALIFLFHPLMGFVAVGGGIILITLTALNQQRSKEPNAEYQAASYEAENLGEAMRQNAEVVQGLGMHKAGKARWEALRQEALEKQLLASDRTSSYSSSSKALRFYLQSVMLAVGAWLVLYQEISPGMMIAGSILMGRALAPIEQAIGQWSGAQRAVRGWRSLGEMLERIAPEGRKTELPKPKGYLDVQKVSVLAPGEDVPALRGISFKVEPGQAIGVIGPSGAGKSTLAKVLTGVWPPAAGKVRLDGAALDQWPHEELGKHIGYLAQDIGLFAGSVAENIARLSTQPDDAQVVLASQRAGAHDLLLSLPQGYNTQIGYGGGRLSGGQRQRVALARALYGDPPVLVLDEPNANLDAQGEQALVDAIRDAKSRGKTVVVMAHRPSAIAACDLLLMIDKGLQVDFGPRDEVLKKRTRNYPQLVGGKGGARSGAAGAQAGQAATAGQAAQPAAAAAQPAAGQPSKPGQPAIGATISMDPASMFGKGDKQ